MEETKPRTGGTQAVHRALGLLKLVAMRHEHGIRIADAAAESGLDRATAYRLLASLTEAGFIERDDGRRYRLGLESMQLGLAAMNRAPILERCRPLMKRLARRTEDTVFLVVRNGDYGHCVHYEEGSYPIRALVLQVGGLRLLGVGSAGAALLATLADPDIEQLHARHAEDYVRAGLSLAHLQKQTMQTRERGYSATDNLVTEGVGGIGVSFEITPGTFAAVSIGAVASRMRAARRKGIASMVAEELAQEGLLQVSG